MAFIQERQRVPIGRDPLWARQEIRPNCRVLQLAEKATALRTVNLSLTTGGHHSGIRKQVAFGTGA